MPPPPLSRSWTERRMSRPPPPPALPPSAPFRPCAACAEEEEEVDDGGCSPAPPPADPCGGIATPVCLLPVGDASGTSPAFVCLAKGGQGLRIKLRRNQLAVYDSGLFPHQRCWQGLVVGVVLHRTLSNLHIYLTLSVLIQHLTRSIPVWPQANLAKKNIHSRQNQVPN